MKKFLLSLALLAGSMSAIADVNPCLKVTNAEVKKDSYGTQLFYRLPNALTSGTAYKLSMRVCFENGLNEGLGFWPYNPEVSGSTQYTGFNKSSFEANKWYDIECSFTANSDITMLQFPIGHVDGLMRIDDVILTAEGQTTNLVNNGSFDNSTSHLTYSNYGHEADIDPDTWWSWSWALPTVEYDATFDDTEPITYDPVYVYPQNCTDMKSIISGVGYPQTFAVQGQNWGNNGTSTTGSDVNDYESISFVVSKGSTGLGIRVWVSDGINTATLYAYPEEEYENVTDWTKSYKITTPGTYKVKLGKWNVLAGIKADNDWGASELIVDYAYATPKSTTNFNAVDEARTFSSKKILDFSEVTDVEAYIATAVDGSSVTMQKVTGAVPANTGLVLVQKAEKSILSIPTCGEATEDVTGNLLVATTAETSVPVGSYVLAGAGDALGWYVIGGIPATLAAGKCYLSVSSSSSSSASGAKSLKMVFGEDATAIKNVEKTTNNTIYSIQGIKVANPVKGNMYIMNGKKVIF